MGTITHSDAISSNNTDFKINHNENKKEAAKNITLAVVVNSLRVKRNELKSLRETLALHTSRESGLRVQVASLKRLLKADCGKLRAAMTELKRLRGGVAGKLDEKQALENEKSALQRSASLAEQRASGLQELWRSCKADLAAARDSAAQAHDQVAAERARARQIRDHNTELSEKVTQNEDEIERLKKDFQKAGLEISDLKKSLSVKEDYIRSIETELLLMKKKMLSKEIEMKEKDDELHNEILKTEKLNEEILSFNVRLQTIQEKINRWPFYFNSSCPLYYNFAMSTNISNWLKNVSTNLFQRFLNIAAMFVIR